MVRMIHIFLAHKRENHVVRVEIARRREQLITVEFHPFAQVEGVDLAILAYLQLSAGLGTSSVVPGLKSTRRL